MHVHVKFKFVRLRKCFATELTNAGLLLCVGASDVAVMRGVRCEGFSTMAALKWFFAAVLSDVSAQNRRCSKCFDAVRAFVWPLATVHSKMLVKARRLGKPLATLAALVWSVFLVHMQDMDAEAVSLFKGAVAKMARVLPVSLVYTPRVFQMFVSVIFVGEHFATPVTGEAVSTCFKIQ